MPSKSSPCKICCSHIFAYRPLRDKSTSCEPCSTTVPFSNTTIWSHCLAVDNLWAMKMAVRPTANCRKDSSISDSVVLSRAEVASSHNSSLGFFRNARASATRCFSPPLSFRPRSPTWVSYPLGSRITTL
mmetsp:Transcript_49501/g.94575  ORF Transcript_49501/g.94575 Transcript_49501/m.94575 type:complete len:130 (-) Transcript_49501:59-448(-)